MMAWTSAHLETPGEGGARKERLSGSSPHPSREMILPSDCCHWHLISVLWGSFLNLFRTPSFTCFQWQCWWHTRGWGREVRLKLSYKEEITPGRRLLPELALPFSVDNLQLDRSSQQGAIPNTAQQTLTILSGAAGESLPVRTCFGAGELQHTLTAVTFAQEAWKCCYKNWSQSEVNILIHSRPLEQQLYRHQFLHSTEEGGIFNTIFWMEN